MDNAIKLLLSIYNSYFQKGFADLIAYKGDITVVGNCMLKEDIENFYQNPKTRPDIVMMDIKYYTFQLMKTLINSNTDIKIIGVTSFYNDYIAATLKNIGAKGYLTRNYEIETMYHIVRSVHKGEIMINKDVIEQSLSLLS
jgi:DNA-binding NarL/FixJ family response regulator